jgi:hypothetical protein
MLRDYLVPARVVVVARSAYNPLVFEQLLKAARAQPHKPAQAIILPVNLRCFSPQWDMHPEWQHAHERRAVSKYLQGHPPIAAIPHVMRTARDKRRYEATRVDYPLSRFKTIGDFRRIIESEPANERERQKRSREIFIFHYGSPLAQNHARLKALSSAVSIARQIAPRVLVYLTPINMDAVHRYVGPQLGEVVKRNVAVIRTAVDEIVDWSAALDAQRFFGPDTATEHLNEGGRRRLTELIGSQLGR